MDAPKKYTMAAFKARLGQLRTRYVLGAKTVPSEHGGVRLAAERLQDFEVAGFLTHIGVRTAFTYAEKAHLRSRRVNEETWLKENGPTELGCIWVPENEVVLGAEACSPDVCHMLDRAYVVVRR